MGDIVFKIFPLALAYIMFTLGMGLQVADFRVIAQNPKAFFMGIFNQVLVLPLVALAIVLIAKPMPELAFGIMLLSFCPGGMTSNLLSYYAKGNVALSIALTGTVSILSIFTLPLFIAYGYSYFTKDTANSISMVKMGIAVFLLTTLPVILGMLTRHKAADFTKRNRKRFEVLASVFFVLIVIVAIITNWASLMKNFTAIGIELTSMVVILLSFGLLSSFVIGLPWIDRKTVAIESGIQNGATAIALAPIIVGTTKALPVIALPAAVYSVIMYLVALPFILWVRNKS